MDFKEEALKVKEDLIADIQTLCRIPSVLDPATAKEGQPFGQGCREALDCMLAFGRRDGFEVKDVDGYAGHIDIGEGDEVIGVLGHLDVVPVNTEGWIYPPFSCTLKDNILYGRGTSDDKGPTLAAYYAAKIIHDLKLPTKKKIRIIFGCDEESGSRCMKHYFSKEPYPQWAFTPDAGFPVCYGEKSGCGYTISGDCPEEGLLSFKAGQRVNIVPETAEAIVVGELSDFSDSFEAFKQKYGVGGSLEEKHGQVRITLIGKSAHASTPDLGKNAIVYLAQYLNEVIDHPVSRFIDDYFRDDNHARRLGFYFNGAMGEITCNVGIIDYEQGHVRIQLDLRCPHDMNFDDMQCCIVKAIKPMGWTEEHHIGPYLFVDPESELITTLHQAYVKYTHDEQAKPVTMGGGTYAKSMPNTCVAFGMEFPGSPNAIHENNEILRVDELMLGVAIYAEALYHLVK